MVRIEFDGVSEETLQPLPGELAQQPGEPLDPVKIRASLRRLYATGLYQTIQVAGVRIGNDVTIVFSGAPRLFIGRVNINGVKDSSPYRRAGQRDAIATRCPLLTQQSCAGRYSYQEHA